MATIWLKLIMRGRACMYRIVLFASTTLFIAAVVFWVLSYRNSDYLGCRYGAIADQAYEFRTFDFLTGRGGILFGFEEGVIKYANAKVMSDHLPKDATAWNGIGLHFHASATPKPIYYGILVKLRHGFVLEEYNSLDRYDVDGNDAVPGSLPAIEDIERRSKYGCPFWCLAILFGIVPFFSLCRWRIREKLNRKRGLEGCRPKCGYDLRASADRCPECGKTLP